MYNSKNNVTLIGRVAQEPHIEKNADGSKKVFVKMAVQDNYRTGDEFGTEFVEVERYEKADKSEYIERLGVGDQVIITGHLTCKSYQKDGETVYPPIKVAVDSVSPLQQAAANKAADALTEDIEEA